MVKNWAIVIGINQYEFLQPLQYAKRDAELMARFLQTEAGFEKVLLFSDDSLETDNQSNRPSRSNLRRVFRELAEQPRMSDGDNFWFFFAGHGVRHEERDYLMPLDGDLNDVENTGIAISYFSERLRCCGADNVVMLLDACRNDGSRGGEGIGNQTAEDSRQTGVISIFACSPKQFSHEHPSLRQGVFTYALLEGLGMRGRCATVERLNKYLEYRIPEILGQISPKARQTPYIIAEPINKSHLILMPQYASLQDIAVLKTDAYQAEVAQNLDLAKRLWIRANVAAAGQDMDVIEALSRIQTQNREHRVHSPAPDMTAKRSSVYSRNALLEEVMNGNLVVILSGCFVACLALLILSIPISIWYDYQMNQSVLQIEKSLSYGPLSDWKRADSLTGKIMREAYTNQLGFSKLSCEHLNRINQIWIKSDGRFGFTPQKYAWQAATTDLPQGSKPDDALAAFGELVGWRSSSGTKKQWLRYDEFQFSWVDKPISLRDKPKGYLPVSWGDIDQHQWDMSALIERLKECDIR